MYICKSFFGGGHTCASSQFKGWVGNICKSLGVTVWGGMSTGMPFPCMTLLGGEDDPSLGIGHVCLWLS